MRRVGTFIFGRPRPLSGDRRADPNYTLDPEEPGYGLPTRQSPLNALVTNALESGHALECYFPEG